MGAKFSLTCVLKTDNRYAYGFHPMPDSYHILRLFP